MSAQRDWLDAHVRQVEQEVPVEWSRVKARYVEDRAPGSFYDWLVERIVELYNVDEDEAKLQIGKFLTIHFQVPAGPEQVEETQEASEKTAEDAKKAK